MQGWHAQNVCKQVRDDIIVKVNLQSLILRSSLITGLDCGLDCWTGQLDWITGLTFELKLCV